MKRRGSSALPAIRAEAEKSTAAGDSHGYSNADDIVHGGEHYSNTAKKLDPRVYGALSEIETYQTGSDAEAGRLSLVQHATLEL